MTAPTTYAEWVALLERFGQGDDTVFDEMDAGSFILDSGTAHRFYSRVAEVYKKRKQGWLEKFQRSFQVQNFKTEDDFGIALRDGKQNLLPLSKFVTAKGLPDELKKTLKKDLEDCVSEIKKSLKDKISKIDKSREKMLMMLSTFGMIENQREVQVSGKKGNQNDLNLTPTSGRKIIF